MDPMETPETSFQVTPNHQEESAEIVVARPAPDIVLTLQNENNEGSNVILFGQDVRIAVTTTTEPIDDYEFRMRNVTVLRDESSSYQLQATNPSSGESLGSGMQVILSGFELEDFMSGEPLTIACEIEWSVVGFETRSRSLLRQQIQQSFQLSSSRGDNIFHDNDAENDDSTSTTHGLKEYDLQIILAMPPPTLPPPIENANEEGQEDAVVASTSSSSRTPLSIAAALFLCIAFVL